MPIGETIPTIGELKGNTILELFKNGYNALKNALTRKQNKLVAGDNIVIDEDTNRISAIEGGTPVLDDYYTKSETDTLLDAKADTTDVYEKTEVYNKTEDDALLFLKADKSDTYTKAQVDALIPEGSIDVITPTLSSGSYGRITFIDELKEGDIVVCNLYNTSNQLVESFVTSYINGSGNASQNTFVHVNRTDANNATIRVQRYNLWFTSNLYQIGNEYNDINIISGTTISVGAYSYTELSAEYSKVTIYRKRVTE